MRWTIGIAGALATVVAVNIFFLYLATQNPDEVVQSYITVEQR